MSEETWIETARTMVYPADCDTQNHLNTTGYMRVFDIAIFQLFFRLGYTVDDLEGNSIGWADVSHQIGYLKEVKAGWPLFVRSAVVKIGRSSIGSIHEIVIECTGEVAARLQATTVQFDLRSRTSLPVLDAVRRAAQERFASRLQETSLAS
ncbi:MULTISPECIES: thioesterase family protein [Rhizobium/Agrobacterium group]|uniref:acyl-CoA thioesterase n=1 Tax=Rhizobium/Agrobacterium group TaxID=227290 RepID=UPI000FDA665A|nr:MULTISPECIES: acyl-CoA thioesterase [Rhizobium/Agrobacterium group]RVT69632.1 acyl-CoA thioesterase [Agrobacterium sp. CNPSo 2736]WHO77288.1 acyl-CoA thioesterase [Rhizobium sp. BT03]